jgi:hypothetical protein
MKKREKKGKMKILALCIYIIFNQKRKWKITDDKSGVISLMKYTIAYFIWNELKFWLCIANGNKTFLWCDINKFIIFQSKQKRNKRKLPKQLTPYELLHFILAKKNIQHGLLSESYIKDVKNV